MTNKRRLTGLAGAVVLGFSLSGCGLFGAGNSSDPVLATVNGQAITNSSWLQSIDGLGVLQGQKLSTTTANKKSQVKQLMIWSAVEQWTLAHHLITKKTAQQQAQKLLTQLETSAGSKATLTHDLKGYGLTLPQFSSFLTQQQILQVAFNKETAHVPVPSVTAEQQFYNQNKTQFMNPQSDQVQVILVKSQTEASSIEAQLKGGANFATLAKKDSIDPSKAQGGELGNVPVSTQSGMPTNFVNVMSGLKAGQYGVASTPSGYYVMQVQKVNPPAEQAFTAVEASIKTYLQNNSKNQAFQSWGTRIEKQYKTQFLMK
jgi:parvulin-like peptidyl-prolyl isomerase